MIISVFNILRIKSTCPRLLVKCDDKKNIIEKNIQKEKEYIKYKELNDPEYFREDFYGLRKVCSPIKDNKNIDETIDKK